MSTIYSWSWTESQDLAGSSCTKMCWPRFLQSNCFVLITQNLELEALAHPAAAADARCFHHRAKASFWKGSLLLLLKHLGSETENWECT